MRAGLKKLIGMMATGALVCGGGAARAESELRQALSQVPGRMMLGKAGFPASFVSLSGLRTISGTAPELEAARRVNVDVGDVLQAYFMNSDGDWRSYTGVGRGDLAGFVGYGDPPSQVLIWRFTDAAKAETLVTGLASRGFKSDNGQWSNGEPMKFDRAKSDRLNPFLGALGRASMLAAVKDGIAQSAAPQAVAEAASLKAEHSLAGQAPVAASLDAIEAAAGKGVVVQALVLSPNVWSLAADPADLMLTKPGQDIKKLAEQLAEKGKQSRVPPTIGAILADIETVEPAGRGAVLALPYADCATAEQAGKIFDERWKKATTRSGQTAAEFTKAQPAIVTRPAKDICLLSITMARAPEKGVANPIFSYIVSAIYQRDFQAL